MSKIEIDYEISIARDDEGEECIQILYNRDNHSTTLYGNEAIQFVNNWRCLINDCDYEFMLKIKRITDNAYQRVSNKKLIKNLQKNNS